MATLRTRRMCLPRQHLQLRSLMWRTLPSHILSYWPEPAPASMMQVGQIYVIRSVPDGLAQLEGLKHSQRTL